MLGFYFFLFISVVNVFVCWRARPQSEAEHKAKLEVHAEIALAMFILFWLTGDSFLLALGVSLIHLFLILMKGFRSVGVPLRALPPRSGALEDFASVCWETLLPALASQARTEPWGEGLWILRYKVCETFRWHAFCFRRATTEAGQRRRIAIAPDASEATFALGLTTPDGCEIFLRLRRNLEPGPFWCADLASALAFSPDALPDAPQWPTLVTPQQAYAALCVVTVVPLLPELLATLHNLPTATLRRLCQEDPSVLACHDALVQASPDLGTQPLYKEAVEARRDAFHPLRECFAASLACRRALERFTTAAFANLAERLRRNYATLRPIRTDLNGEVTLASPCFLAPLTHAAGGLAGIEGVVTLRLRGARLEAYAFVLPAVAYAQARLVVPPTDWPADWWRTHAVANDVR